MAERGKREIRGWKAMMDKAAERLESKTGATVAEWNQRVREANPSGEPALRKWLTEQGVGGYAQDLLVWERHGYPDFMLTEPTELINAQYADRQHLRPICDAVLDAAYSLGDVVVQARKTYISLVSPKRTFAIVKATTKNRVDVGLNLPGREPGGRLLPAKSLDKGTVRIALESPEEVDDEFLRLFEECYQANI
ncbi:hypothetical protein ALI22I_14130 [Saccharothrix sp. ALI-22-I]|uniref:DUF5655 domain-containing protein n=1 Tax=Saccharothrix sp. ALI-22-I TaxID=1933778 RepID=UPI00097BB17D|nr:DUF5655 domain-containing protein [Saccharothrix sp. ALI-22-I]ONI90039.1 hypothetical protein ALI22I_14130 [Saccharothrix sp. ALI-22-I]